MKNKNWVGAFDIIAELSDEDYDLDADGIFYVDKKLEKTKEKRRKGLPLCMRLKEKKLKEKKNWISRDGGLNL